MSWSQEGAHDQWRTCTWTPLHMTSQQGCTIYRTLSPIVVVNIDRYFFLKCGLCCAPITRGRTRPKASLISCLNKRVPPAAAVLSCSVDWCLEKKVRQEKTTTNQNTKIAKANVWKQIPVRPSGNPGNNNSDPPPGRTADDYLPKTRRTEAMLFDIHKDASSKYSGQRGLKKWSKHWTRNAWSPHAISPKSKNVEGESKLSSLACFCFFFVVETLVFIYLFIHTLSCTLWLVHFIFYD